MSFKLSVEAEEDIIRHCKVNLASINIWDLVA